MQSNLIRDAMYNLAPHSGASSEYAKGVFVGVVSVIMAYQNKGFYPALEIAIEAMPGDWRESCVPEAWLDETKRIYRELIEKKIKERSKCNA